VIRNENEKKQLTELLKDSFVRTKSIVVNPWEEDANYIKEKIWQSLGLIVVYTRKTETPMALPVGSTIKDFAKKIHKDFVRDFRFARLWRTEGSKKRMMQAGLDYVLRDNDVVEIHTR
jgi:ribosome-interacting GTPase 1